MSGGNMLGQRNRSTSSTAPGIWNLQEHYLAVKSGNWPSGSLYVTTNLVLYLDAGSASSYPGSGTTWTDLSGAGNNATLVNSPTYSSGSIVFNGSNQYASVSLTKTASCTFSCWAKTSSISQPMLFNAGPDGTGPDLFFYSGVISWNTWDSTSASFGSIPATANNGNWHLYTVVVDQSANNTKLYYDGSLLGSTTYKSAANYTNLYIGGNTNSYMWNGSIAIFSINNTALTATEVLSNYNNLKSRFGY